VRDIVGNYPGPRTLFGIDEQGEVVKRSAGTDIVQAENPRVKDHRARATMTDEMAFEGRTGPPVTVRGS